MCLEVEVVEEESVGGGGGILNVIGILLAGGLGGYVFLRGKQQEETETTLRSELQTERSNLSKLE